MIYRYYWLLLESLPIGEFIPLRFCRFLFDMDRLPGSLHNFIAHLAGLEVNSSAGRCGPWSTWGVWSKKAPCWDLPSLLFMKSSWLAFKIPSKRIQFAVSWCGVVPQRSISFGRTSDFYNGTCRCSWHFPYFLIALSVRTRNLGRNQAKLPVPQSRLCCNSLITVAIMARLLFTPDPSLVWKLLVVTMPWT